MGFLSSLFGSKPDYPAVAQDTPLAGQLNDVKAPLQTLLGMVKDRVEVVPLQGRSIVFIGDPPKGRFGVAWIEGGKVQNFQSLAKEKGLAPTELHQFGEKFRAAYENSMPTQRFTATIAGRDVVVTPDPQLGKEIQQVISSALN